MHLMEFRLVLYQSETGYYNPNLCLIYSQIPKRFLRRVQNLAPSDTFNCVIAVAVNCHISSYYFSLKYSEKKFSSKEFDSLLGWQGLVSTCRCLNGKNVPPACESRPGKQQRSDVQLSERLAPLNLANHECD